MTKKYKYWMLLFHGNFPENNNDTYIQISVQILKINVWRRTNEIDYQTQHRRFCGNEELNKMRCFNAAECIL